MAAFYALGLANIFLRSSMGVLAPELSGELALAPEMLGAIASGFFVAYALMQIPTGILLDRFGPLVTVTGAFLMTVVGTYLFAIAASGGLMLMGRVLMGAGCAGVFAGAFMVISRFFSNERFTVIGGTLNSFAMVGNLLATAPLAALVSITGWRLSFVAVTIVLSLILLLAAVSIRDYPVASKTRSIAQSESLRAMLSGSLAVLRTPGVLPLAGAGFALSAGNTLLGIWGGPYLNDVYGLVDIERGKVLSWMALSGVAGHFIYGRAARWFNTLKWLVVGGGAGITVIMAALALLPNPSVFAVTLLLAGLGFACSFPTILLAHARALVPEYLIGRGITTVNTGIMIAIAMMQLAVGALIGWLTADNGGDAAFAYRGAFGFISVMALLSTLNYLRVRDCKPLT